MAYNDPSGVSVHAINADGGVGAEVPQRASLDAGVYAHQVRVLPSNRAVVVVTRGNEPTASSREDPGALKVFHYDAGKLSDEISIAPQNGLGFRSRHLDFHPTRPWVFLTIESQNQLQMYRSTDEGLEPTPSFSASTQSDGGGVRPGQTASTVHVHPNGRFVYVGNRARRPAAATRSRCSGSTRQPASRRSFRTSTRAASRRGPSPSIPRAVCSLSATRIQCRSAKVDRRSWCPPISRCSALEQWDTRLRAALRRRGRPQAAMVDGNRRVSLTTGPFTSRGVLDIRIRARMIAPSIRESRRHSIWTD